MYLVLISCMDRISLPTQTDPMERGGCWCFVLMVDDALLERGAVKPLGRAHRYTQSNSAEREYTTRAGHK